MNEDELIAQMRQVLPVGERTEVWSGDDCAQIATPEGHTIITTDVLVDGYHFRRDWSDATQVGARAAAQNLADIASQGGLPTALVVSITIPKGFDLQWILQMVRGFAGEVAPTGAGVVGGDLSGGQQLTIAVTALGYCPYGGVLRSGARPGDTVTVAGTLGYSAAGYALLAGGHVPTDPHAASALGELEPFVEVFRTPHPPYEAGPQAAKAKASAMMDLSDGLTTDATRMAKASGVTIDLDHTLLNSFASALNAPAMACKADAWKWILDGGEDHSMLATFPPQATLPPGFVPIGRVTSKVPSQPLRLDGVAVGAGGWDHLRPSDQNGQDHNGQ
ncbi:MAG: thiamine-phosphate kinase [Actinomycetaceae bacterium]|nr:thiamine-phosphate kinase [Actinomycetaceae bacterium]